MSRIIPIGLAGQYSGSAATLTKCLHLIREDGLEVFETALDRGLVIDGDLYRPNCEIMDIVLTVGLAPDNTELRVLPDDMTDPGMRDDVLSGRWDNAHFRIFEVNYLDVDVGQVPIMRGTFGQLTDKDGEFTIELRSLKQYLQQSVGSALSPTCRARFADFPTPVLGNLCRLDVEDWTVTGAVTSVGVATHRVFTDSARAEPDDAFGEGFIKFTTGANAGLSYKIRDYADGVFTLSTPTYLPVQVGDLYTAVWGCRKRHERRLSNPAGVSDCIDKFDNILNMQAEPFGVGPDVLTGAPDRSGA